MPNVAVLADGAGLVGNEVAGVEIAWMHSVAGVASGEEVMATGKAQQFVWMLSVAVVAS